MTGVPSALAEVMVTVAEEEDDDELVEEEESVSLVWLFVVSVSSRLLVRLSLLVIDEEDDMTLSFLLQARSRLTRGVFDSIAAYDARLAI